LVSGKASASGLQSLKQDMWKAHDRLEATANLKMQALPETNF
jgi:hypothetical protein